MSPMVFAKLDAAQIDAIKNRPSGTAFDNPLHLGCIGSLPRYERWIEALCYEEHRYIKQIFGAAIMRSIYGHAAAVPRKHHASGSSKESD